MPRPWAVVLYALQLPGRLCFCPTMMPRPCAVVLHACSYQGGSPLLCDATALCRGDSRSLLLKATSRLVTSHSQLDRRALAVSVRDHGARPWHARSWRESYPEVAANVRDHGARPWHEWLVGVHTLQHFREFFHLSFGALHRPPAVQIGGPGGSLRQRLGSVLVKNLGH